MGRSLKKGPFVAYHLLKKIDQMNKSGKKDFCNDAAELGPRCDCGDDAICTHGHVLFF